MTSALAIVLLGAAGFGLGGAYSLFKQRKPWWVVALVAIFAILCLGAGLLYL
ncbi:MAG TPA: hypothetical protein VFX15_10430 [Actinomycetes bacterium]|nr:hypothetical protein [Actinomycetes bacterium]